jgi:hypothetical protein
VEVTAVGRVMIGIDAYKGSHSAFVIDGREKQLGQLPPGSRHARPERSGVNPD